MGTKDKKSVNDLKEYQVTFIGHHVINVMARSYEEADEIASNDFDGFCDWETEVDEID